MIVVVTLAGLFWRSINHLHYYMVRIQTRNALAKQRYAGNAGSADPALIEPTGVHLQSALENRLPDDVYNIDETAFQYVMYKV